MDLETFSGCNNCLFLLLRVSPKVVELRADEHVVSPEILSEATTWEKAQYYPGWA